jgi:hypothetical protein
LSSEIKGTQTRGPLQAPPDSPAKKSKRPGVWAAHPKLMSWLVLSVGMVAILLWAARNAELLTSQRLFLVLATIGLAGLCAWIIDWEG